VENDSSWSQDSSAPISLPTGLHSTVLGLRIEIPALQISWSSIKSPDPFRKPKNLKKFFVPQKIFPVCPCPTPLIRGIKNIFISYGTYDVIMPE
jgi:hypothetical protein